MPFVTNATWLITACVICWLLCGAEGFRYAMRNVPTREVGDTSLFLLCCIGGPILMILAYTDKD